MVDLTLASASPRRKELLQQIGVCARALPVDLDESVLPGEHPREFVARLAREKAEAGFQQAGDVRPALGSDTAVVLNGRIMGKPVDEAQALDMLLSLSGRVHQVMTGVSVVDASKTLTEVVVTDVEFDTISEQQARQYWASGEPCDKAGGYGIQGLGAVFVRRITGSYSAVVGLPLHETAKLLLQFEVPVWQPAERPVDN
ncbi:MAG: Maf-like protein [Marinobacterium sp.]|nr:Maf-like protein [Marinobacterium sp.]